MNSWTSVTSRDVDVSFLSQLKVLNDYYDQRTCLFCSLLEPWSQLLDEQKPYAAWNESPKVLYSHWEKGQRKKALTNLSLPAKENTLPFSVAIIIVTTEFYHNLLITFFPLHNYSSDHPPLTNMTLNQMWWCPPIIPALGRWKQEDVDIANLGYIVTPCLKTNKQTSASSRPAKSPGGWAAVLLTCNGVQEKYLSKRVLIGVSKTLFSEADIHHDLI
jgi:hypothetical protein